MAIANACMDMNFNEYSNSIFSNFNPTFWNPSQSYVNKWKNGNKADGEKFFGSSTFLVFLTDSWHLFKMIFLSLLFMTIVISAAKGILFFKLFTNPILNYILIYILYTIIWGIVFEISEYLLTKKS